MARKNGVLLVLILSMCFSKANAVTGTDVPEEELRQYFAISPTGAGLPRGTGNAEDGKTIYELKCAMCHGHQLQGVPATGGPALVGGRDTLKQDVPLKTVESYWPFATTLFDYIWRAMPFYSPGSLNADEVYALCAYILASGAIVDSSATMNATSLPKVKMPNADGFYQSPLDR